MRPFVKHTGIAAPLLRDNVDTDAIIPSRHMSRVSRKGLGGALFAGWRFLDNGLESPDSKFVLNDSRYRQASILLAGTNFGCGSSREHAVWALDDFGIRVIIARSFGAIFEANCFRNGILPIVKDQETITALAALCDTCEISIDLESCELRAADQQWRFSVPARQRQDLLAGVDPIDQTLRFIDDIASARRARNRRMPWAEIYQER